MASDSRSGHRTPPVDEDFSAVDQLAILTQLNTVIHDTQPLRSMLNQVSGLARAHIPGADVASITVLQQGQTLEVGFTGGFATSLDERQYQPPYGPSHQAATTGEVIHLRTTAADSRYPEYVRQADRHGVRQILAVGMPCRHTVNAALTIYATRPDAVWTERTTEAAFSFARCIHASILNAVLYRLALEEARQLRQAMMSRAGIEQAKGMIMLNHRCTPDEAFEHLSQTSARTHRKLRDVADDLIRASLNP
jgi:hypothetical protein